MATAVTHLYPEASEVRDGRLTIGGCDAIELAREFGTPVYAVAEADLRNRAREFAAAMGDGEVVFASKAFPCTAVLRVFAAHQSQRRFFDFCLIGTTVRHGAENHCGQSRPATLYRTRAAQVVLSDFDPRRIERAARQFELLGRERCSK